MKKIAIIILIIFLLPISSFASANGIKDMKAAFIRDGNLWTIIDGTEKQITLNGHVHHPEWSYDGQWLLYEKEAPSQFEHNKIQNEIWVYHIETAEKRRIFFDGYNPQWSPNKNLVAFHDNGVLNVSDLKEFYNIALGVYGFTWLPDGKGFLMSSNATLNPDGWTSPVLYTKPLLEDLKKVDLFSNVQEFFVVPKNLRKGNKEVMSNHVGSFENSPSKKWISFIVSPTASLAMDSNMLCAVSADGEKFEMLDEIIYGVGAPKWAPSKDILAYIAGGGRIVFGFKGKDLKYKEFPVSLTPTDFAELNFTWVDNKTLVTSRVQAKEWSNEFSEHPLPSLYKIDIHNNKQVKIIDAGNGTGHYDPQYIPSMEKLIWYRGTSITDQNRNLWIADRDGSNAKLWIKNVDVIEVYEGQE